MIPKSLEDALARESDELAEHGKRVLAEAQKLPDAQAFALYLEQYRRISEAIGMFRAVQHCGSLAETSSYATLELRLQEIRERSYTNLVKLYDAGVRLNEANQKLLTVQEKLLAEYKRIFTSISDLGKDPKDRPEPPGGA